jgi:hypothetical protein
MTDGRRQFAQVCGQYVFRVLWMTGVAPRQAARRTAAGSGQRAAGGGQQDRRKSEGGAYSGQQPGRMATKPDGPDGTQLAAGGRELPTFH